MPQVIVRYNSRINTRVLERLRLDLPIAVARALNVPNTPAALIPLEVDVEFRMFREFDIHGNDIDIRVEANFYDERERTLDRRRAEIAAEVAWLREKEQLNAGVWVRLTIGSYGHV